jgi:ABC-type Co2+ transport system permease subunit
MLNLNNSAMDLTKRALKYIFEGLAVAFVALLAPKKTLSAEEVLLLGLVAAMTFAVLDTFIPTIAASARSGAGFGIGANLVGFPKM